MRRLLSLVLVAALLAPIALAAKSSSGSYNISTTVTGGGGSNVTSGSYKHYIALSIISGILNSSSYLNSLGIFHTILLANGQPCTSANQCEGGFCCSSVCRSSGCPSDEVSGGGGGGAAGAGGGGGGGPLPPVEGVHDFSISPDTFHFSLVLGEENTSVMILSNDGEEPLDGTLSVLGVEDFITLSPTTIANVQPDEDLAITLHALGRRLGAYLGQIQAVANSITRTADVVIDVESTQALFDVKMDVPRAFKILRPDEILQAQITLLNVGPPQRIDVFLTYLIKDARGRVLSEESETFAVFGERSFVHQFQTPLLEPGKYLAVIEVRYGNSFAVSSDTFTIPEKGDSPVVQITKKSPIFFIALAVLAGALFITVSYFIPRKPKRRIPVKIPVK